MLLQNWAGNLEYRAERLIAPKSVEEMQEAVRSCPVVRPLGARHSFNDIADTTGVLVTAHELPAEIEINRAAASVSVTPGISYGDLAKPLDEAGFALPNLASLPHISVGGACATATHGSGILNPSLANAVMELDLVKADGELVRLGPEQIDAAAVHLGTLGMVVKMRLSLIPTFKIRQTVYEKLPFQTALDHLEHVMGAAYSVSLFTSWTGDFFDQAWVKRSLSDSLAELDFFGANAAGGPRHPIGHMDPANCTQQMDVPGPWYERLPHFRLEFTPSAGEELQSEFIVPFEFGVEALNAVNRLRERIAPVLLISEIRSVEADTQWLSPFHAGRCLAIHFTWKKDWPAVSAVLPEIESALSPYGARPHWGKLFNPGAFDFPRLYHHLPAFQALAEEMDPDGKFRNSFIDLTLFASNS